MNKKRLPLFLLKPSAITAKILSAPVGILILNMNYYNLFTSEAVLFELGRSNYPAPKRAATLEMVVDIAVLPLTDEVVFVANTYRRELVMPKEPSLDSLHLALASCHGCDILLTWNCDHLANANKHGHIKRVNDRLKLATPLLITPIELLKGPL